MPQHSEEDYLIPSTAIKFTIEYSEDDDLRKFADYLIDLDIEKKSIYFEYNFKPTLLSLGQALEDFYKKLKTRFDKIKADSTNEQVIKQLKELMLKAYELSIKEICYFNDKNFNTKFELDISIFRKLFNFKYILGISRH